MAARARIVDGSDLAIEGHGRLYSVGAVQDLDGVDYYLLGTLEGAGPASLASLRRAVPAYLRLRKKDPWFREIRPGESRRVAIGIVTSDESGFMRRLQSNDEWILDDFFRRPPTPAVLSWAEDEDQFLISFAITRDEQPDVADVEKTLAPFLSRQDCIAKVIVSPREEDERPGFKVAVGLRGQFPRGATLADAWRLGEEAMALLEAVDGDELSRDVAVDLLAAGRWDLFKGQPESDWLEAKGAPYAEANRRLGENWKYELAKDVAAFANSPGGGVIVIGMTTEDSGDGEVITGVKQFDLRLVTASTYTNHIARHVHPRLEGFQVIRVPGRERGRGIAMLVVPRQDRSNFPFLVRGTVRDRAILGNHFLWPIRLGDQTAMLDADGLHARLRLGDQAIKGPIEIGHRP